MGDKRVETLGSKIRFLSVFVTFSPFPPKTMLIFLFLRLHRPQRLHNIELGSRGIRELTLDANKVEKCLSIEKRDFLKVSHLLLSLIAGLDFPQIHEIITNCTNIENMAACSLLLQTVLQFDFTETLEMLDLRNSNDH